MISTVLNGDPVFLLNDAWNGKSDFKLDGSVIRDEQLSLTKRSARRPYSQTLVCKCQFQVTLQDSEVRLAIGSLRMLNTQKVVLPLWPAIANWSDRAASPVTGGLMLVFKADWSNWAIYAAGSEPGWPLPTDLWAPVILGFLTPTQPKMLTPDAATWDIDFTESSPAAYALSFTGAAAAAGPQPAGYAAAPRLLPLQPDFQQVMEQISVEVNREQIGFSREPNETFYPQAATRLQNASYTLQDAEVWSMLKFFVDVMGPGASFWASTWLEAARLTADVGAADTVLHVEDTHGVTAGDYFSFYAGGSALATAKATALTANTITIAVALGTAFLANSTLLFQLCLVRLSKSVLSLAWKRPGAAKCQLQWEELPPEYVIAADETLATTIGKLPLRVVLIQLTRDLLNGTVLNWYYTAFEDQIIGLGHTWLSTGTWGVGDITKGLNLEEDILELTSFIFDGNPLLDDVALRAETPLTVTIRYADYDGAALSNVQIVFTGDCAAPSRQGNKIIAKCKFGPALFETQLPRMVRGTMCNFLGGSNNDGSFLISAGCTLLKANWKFTALVEAPVSNAFPFALFVSDTLTGVGANAIAALSGGAIFANWFANGWVEWGAGANIQRRLIIGSTALGGGLTLTLHRYFSALPAIGDTVTLYPGCDGLFTTCKAYDAVTNPTGKFNNYVNFGGEPFTPIANPSTSGQPNLGTQGGKK